MTVNERLGDKSLCVHTDLRRDAHESVVIKKESLERN